MGEVSELKPSNNSTPLQPIEIVDPEGSCKNDNQEAVYRLYWCCLDFNGDWKWQPVPEHHRLSELNLDSCKIITQKDAIELNGGSQ